LVVLEFRRRRGKEFVLEDARRSPFFSFPFFGSLEACMGRSGCSGYLFPLFFAPPSFFEIAVVLLSLQNVRSLTFFVLLLSPLPSFSTFSSLLSFPFLSLSLSLHFLSSSIYAFHGLTFLSRFFFFSDQQPPTGPYTRGAKIRPSCSVDL